MLALEPHFMSDPAISPDGQTVCFVYQGDLWTVPFEGGTASRLTSTPSNEWGPMYSPDGNYIAFNSDREGQGLIFIMPVTGGNAGPVIREPYSVTDWFADGKSILATSSQLGFGTTYYRLYLDGSRPVEITGAGDFYGSLNADNSKIIFNRRGYPYRPSYKGSVNGELWEYDINAKTYTKLTDTDITERYPVCSKKDDIIYYAKSDGKNFQLVKVKNHDFSKPDTLSTFSDWSCRDISIAKDNDSMVFEYFDSLWRFDSFKVFGNKVEKININIPEDLWQDDIVREDVTNKFDNFTVSNDQKWIAFMYKYDLFAVPTKGGEVRQLTHDLRCPSDMVILPDNRTILFSAYQHGEYKLFTINIENPGDINIVPWSENKYIEGISYAPKQQYIIGYSSGVDQGRIAIADSTGLNIREVLTDEVSSSNFALSDDGKYALYTNSRPGIWTSRLIVMDMADKKKHTIYSDDSSIGNAYWGKDGKSIFFARGDGIWRIDLVPRNDFEWDKDQWKDIFTTTVRDSLKKNKKTNQLQFDWNLIDKRLTQIVKRNNWCSILQVADDSTFFYVSWDDKRPTIYKVNYNGTNEEEIASIEPHMNSDFFLNDRSTYYYATGGAIKSINLKTHKKEEYSNSFHYEFSNLALNKEIFKQAWGEFGRNFYDTNFHGVNWNASYDRYLPYMDYATTPSLMGNIIEEMIGNLNASHTGFTPRKDNDRYYTPVAAIGVNFDYRQLLNNGITIQNIYRESKLAEVYGIKAGDILMSVDGIKIVKNTPIDSLFFNKIGKRIKLKFSHEGTTIDAEVKGLSWGENYQLFNKERIEKRRSIVEKNTLGQVGYIHIDAMSEPDYKQFVEDLFADNFDKEGLVLDVRGNSGGHIHDKLIEVLTKKAYAFSTNRHYNAKYPTPTSTFQKPIVLLIDEDSFSDGEIFPHLFSQLKLGKIVGMPTSGSVIGTVEYTLRDRSEMRLPTSGWYNPDGTNMEGSGAQPDIQVDNTPGDLMNDVDAQLLRAIEVILAEIPATK